MVDFVGEWQQVTSTVLFWLRWLAREVYMAGGDTDRLVKQLDTFWRGSDPLAFCVAATLLLGTLCFLFSLPTNNHSWIDKFWSIVPVGYTWYFALVQQSRRPGAPLDPRLLTMACLVTVWGARLTYNFARKGGYRWSGEDYRWPYIRARMHPLAFQLFNATFISHWQLLLLLLNCGPAYLAWQNVGSPLTAVDALAAALVAFFIAYETIADQQQWNFQTAKHARLAAGKRLSGEFARGFLTAGLWHYSRHPNFWAEQSIWWSMYLFGVAASGRWVNWTLAGPVLLSLLFQGSTSLTEQISASKYPKYAEYQATTSCFFPWPPADASGAQQAAEDADVAAPSTPAAQSEEEEGEEGEEGEEEAEPATAGAVKDEEEEQQQEEQQQPRRGRRASTRAAGAGAGAATAPTPGPASAVKRRTSGRASSKGAADKNADTEPVVHAAKAGMEAEAEDGVGPAAPSAAKRRSARSPRKSTRAAASEQSVPLRQSSRLRAKAAGAV